ncbi:hypothetical protein PRIPAC_78112 [Pristionchus pacificus]|uniref:Branched-chain-amino-acid aminotransferase n=1 Tax=Pristionchus pacificus TaxID=54126 RepID=A0A2A6CKU7_PRIPA|nr:hypothetical protein PRIPAC_78112 [Pristionchus pacificus]|eukprot:PDM78718.1 hypothetical protein PRIPAC_31297 [Pristionchus pacificus]
MITGRIISLISGRNIRRSSTVVGGTGKFDAKKLEIHRSVSKNVPKEIPPFGTVATDHMLEIDFKGGEWQTPMIRAVEDLKIHPLAKVLHYCPVIIEGLKAFRGIDGQIRIFRGDASMSRMLASAKRAALPEFCPTQLEEMIVDLVRVDKEWIPLNEGTALYIRPLMAGLGVTRSKEAKLVVVCSPVGSYLTSGALKLYANPAHSRVAPDSAGAFKMGCNYAPTIALTDEAAAHGCAQSLWLWGEKQLITEAGTSNLFLFWKDKLGELELITPPTQGGLILPGITRDSILTLAREWAEFKVTERFPTMSELMEAAKEGRILEVFCSGTASVVMPCDRIVYKQKPYEDPVEMSVPCQADGESLYKKLHEAITGIQYGKIDRPEWTRIVKESTSSKGKLSKSEFFL